MEENPERRYGVAKDALRLVNESFEGRRQKIQVYKKIAGPLLKQCLFHAWASSTEYSYKPDAERADQQRAYCEQVLDHLLPADVERPIILGHGRSEPKRKDID